MLTKKSSIEPFPEAVPNEGCESTISSKKSLSQSIIGALKTSKIKSKKNLMQQDQILDCPHSIIEQLVF